MDIIPGTPSSTNYLHFKRASSFYTGVSIEDDSDVRPPRNKSLGQGLELEMSSPTPPKSRREGDEYPCAVDTSDEMVPDSEPISTSTTKLRDNPRRLKAKVTGIPKTKRKPARPKQGKPKATGSRTKNAATSSTGPTSFHAVTNPNKRSVEDGLDNFDLPPTPKGPPPSKKRAVTKNAVKPIIAPTSKTSAPAARRTARKPKRPIFPDSGIEMVPSSSQGKGKAVARSSSDHRFEGDTIVVQPAFGFAASQRQTTDKCSIQSTSSDPLLSNTFGDELNEEIGTDGNDSLPGNIRNYLSYSWETKTSQVGGDIPMLPEHVIDAETGISGLTQEPVFDQTTSTGLKSGVTCLGEAPIKVPSSNLIIISSDESEDEDGDTDNHEVADDFVSRNGHLSLPRAQHPTAQSRAPIHSKATAEDSRIPVKKLNLAVVDDDEQLITGQTKLLSKEEVNIDKEITPALFRDSSHQTVPTVNLRDEAFDLSEHCGIGDERARNEKPANKQPQVSFLGNVDRNHEVLKLFSRNQVVLNTDQTDGSNRDTTKQHKFAAVGHRGAHLLKAVDNRKRSHSPSPFLRKKGKPEKNDAGKISRTPRGASRILPPEQPRTPERKRPPVFQLEENEHPFDTPFREETLSATSVDPFATTASTGISTPFYNRLLESRSSRTRSYPMGYDMARAEDMVQKADDVFTRTKMDLPAAELMAPTTKHGRVALEMLRTRYSQMLQRALKPRLVNHDGAIRWKEAAEKNEASLNDKIHNITTVLTRHLKTEQPALDDVVTDYRVNGHQAIDYLAAQHALERTRIQGQQALERRALTGTVERAGYHIRTLLDRLRDLDVEKPLSEDRTSELLARFRTKDDLEPAAT